MPDQPMFQGNGIFRDPGTGSPVLPDNAIAQRMRAGIFGPNPNNTAPPNFLVAPPGQIDPAMMVAALRSGLLPNIAGGKPPAAAPAAAPSMAPAAPMPPWLNQPFGPGGDIGVGYGSFGGPGMGYDSGGLAGMSGWGGIGFGGTDTGIY